MAGNNIINLQNINYKYSSPKKSQQHLYVWTSQKESVLYKEVAFNYFLSHLHSLWASEFFHLFLLLPRSHHSTTSLFILKQTKKSRRAWGGWGERGARLRVKWGEWVGVRRTRLKEGVLNLKEPPITWIYASYTETYPADCRKIAAVDSHNSIGIERKENINKIDFCIKRFLRAIYFDVIS